ncbi:MAG: type II secretion system F family protein [Dehalococcoidia bacterium]|nr:type II secretion system F family protein [Dehalococcoidia bacterium]
MLALIPLSVFITVVLLMWAVNPPGLESVEGRLRRHGYMPASRQMVELDKPFSNRVLGPLLEQATSLVIRIAPQEMQRRTAEKLEQANVAVSPAGFLFLTTVIALVLPLIVISPALRSGTFGVREAFFGLALFFFGTRLPGFWLSRKITARQTRIRKSLPDALDLITICVEAGYGLDAALAKVAEKTRGPLADELSRALLEVSLGKPRGQALKDMAQRAGVAELQSFIATVVQAEQMGVSIAGVLRVQSDSMRVRRRQRAEEAAMKAPVKMLIPLVLFIFPAMFVVLLGPVAIKMVTTFATNPI